MELRIEDITIGERIRKDFGDLQSLADSIADIGLLQPIGVTPENMLVFGERRLRAVRDLLQWETIPVRVVDIESIVLGEHAENELRKDFTVSERVAIGKQIEALLGERRGRPTTQGEKENVENFPHFEQGTKTRDVAAEKAGFGNARTYQQAKRVIEEGTDSLVEALDSGRVAISTAADLADLDDEEQEEILARGEGEILRKAKEIKRERAKRRIEERTAQRARAVTLDHPLSGHRYLLLHGDLIEKYEEIGDDSVDVIITDPPYPEQFLPVYRSLWAFASHVLRPGGHLLVMTGQSHLPHIFFPFSHIENNNMEWLGLRYQWTLGYFTPGQSTQVFGRKVKSNWKPVLWFVKGKNEWEHVEDTVRSDMNDKRFHDWGQSVGGMAQLIERFTVKQAVVCDPFCGGGATGVAALELGRFFVGIDIDNACLQQTAERLQRIREAA